MTTHFTTRLGYDENEISDKIVLHAPLITKLRLQYTGIGNLNNY